MARRFAHLKLPGQTVQARFDILGLGCAAVDELIYVPAYPPADAKTRVERRERHCGGLTATALVAAARLGATCAYAGVLGLDDASRFVLECLKKAGVDVNRAVSRAGAKPIHSVIVVDERRRTRNVFFDLENVVGADARLPAKAFIESARVLFVDHFGLAGMLRGAEHALGDFQGSPAGARDCQQVVRIHDLPDPGPQGLAQDRHIDAMPRQDHTQLRPVHTVGLREGDRSSEVDLWPDDHEQLVRVFVDRAQQRGHAVDNEGVTSDSKRKAV